MAELTVYPDAGSGATTVDGYIFKTDVTWDAARNAASGSSPNKTGNLIINAQEETGEFTIFRVFVTFDTSELGVGATITAAVLSLKGTAGSAGSPTVHCVESTQASDNDLVGTDYNDALSVSFANVSSWSASLYNAFTLSATGRAIISLIGVSKYAFRIEQDFSNVTPEVAEVFTAVSLSADEAGTSTDPKLVITYTPPAVANTRTSRRLGFGLGLDI